MCENHSLSFFVLQNKASTLKIEDNYKEFFVFQEYCPTVYFFFVEGNFPLVFLKNSFVVCVFFVVSGMSFPFHRPEYNL